jgi:hypothetical protein
MAMNWVEIPNVVASLPGLERARTFRSGGLLVLVTKDPPGDLWHLSISHRNRYPVWDEIKAARYDLVPNNVMMAMLLPPKEEYVDLHPNTFHLHEIRE